METTTDLGLDEAHRMEIYVGMLDVVDRHEGAIRGAALDRHPYVNVDTASAEVDGRFHVWHRDGRPCPTCRYQCFVLVTAVTVMKFYWEGVIEPT